MTTSLLRYSPLLILLLLISCTTEQADPMTAYLTEQINRQNELLERQSANFPARLLSTRYSDRDYYHQLYAPAERIGSVNDSLIEDVVLPWCAINHGGQPPLTVDALKIAYAALFDTLAQDPSNKVNHLTRSGAQERIQAGLDRVFPLDNAYEQLSWNTYSPFDRNLLSEAYLHQIIASEYEVLRFYKSQKMLSEHYNDLSAFHISSRLTVPKHQPYALPFTIGRRHQHPWRISALTIDGAQRPSSPYTFTPAQAGPQQLEVMAYVQNVHSGERDTLTRTFYYTVLPN